jgi:lipopolysaccharide assembly outer membrane protein LptD (OstA)
LLSLFWGQAFASSSFDLETVSELYHITADRTLYHSRERVKEAFGHVVVSAEGKRLACDYLWVDDNTKEIKARGNVIFVDRESTVEAAELNFNMDTGFGSIFYGRVYNDLYSLRGQLIRKVGEGRYLTTAGEYTTCKDCPESWKLAARNVDLTVEGYAFMDGVFIKVKDIPTLYLPYLVVPVKRKRQTGLLFPRMGGYSNHGFVFVQPLFVAIDDHQDATIAFGKYSDRGLRYEMQYRYKSYNGITGQLDGYYTDDRNYAHGSNRKAVKIQNEWPFFDHFGMRWRFLEMRDRDYIFDFTEDLSATSLPAIESNAVAQAPFNDFFLSTEVRRYRNIVYDEPIGTDGGMVQTTPTVHFGVKERRLAGPVLGSFYGRFDNFTRRNGAFQDLRLTTGNKERDGIFNPDFSDPLRQERLREAKRYIVSPQLSMPFSVGRFMSLTPSVQANQINYRFSLPPPNQPLGGTDTSYVRWRIEARSTLERVYDYDSATISKVKHQLSPFVAYSYIPGVRMDRRHVFQQQLQTADGLFDQFDIVPYTNSTNFQRYPEGRSIYYGFESRVIKKNKRADDMPRAYPYDLLPPPKPKQYAIPKNRKQELEVLYARNWDEHHPNYDLYSEVWTLSASQAYDFIDAENNPLDKKRAFSFLLAKSNLILDKFSNNIEFKYYPSFLRPQDTNTQALTFHDKKNFYSSTNWIWKSASNMHGTRSILRSLNFAYSRNEVPDFSHGLEGTINWSLNDFMHVTFGGSWDFLEHKQKNWLANLTILHPSECWGLFFHSDWAPSRIPNRASFGVELMLNLTGSGFMGAKSMQGQSGGLWGSGG